MGAVSLCSLVLPLERPSACAASPPHQLAQTRPPRPQPIPPPMLPGPSGGPQPARPRPGHGPHPPQQAGLLPGGWGGSAGAERGVPRGRGEGILPYWAARGLRARSLSGGGWTEGALPQWWGVALGLGVVLKAKGETLTPHPRSGDAALWQRWRLCGQELFAEVADGMIRQAS